MAEIEQPVQQEAVDGPGFMFDYWSPANFMEFVERVLPGPDNQTTRDTIRGFGFDGDMIGEILREPDGSQLLPIPPEAYALLRENAQAILVQRNEACRIDEEAHRVRRQAERDLERLNVEAEHDEPELEGAVREEYLRRAQNAPHLEVLAQMRREAIEIERSVAERIRLQEAVVNRPQPAREQVLLLRIYRTLQRETRIVVLNRMMIIEREEIEFRRRRDEEIRVRREEGHQEEVPNQEQANEIMRERRAELARHRQLLQFLRDILNDVPMMRGVPRLDEMVAGEGGLNGMIQRALLLDEQPPEDGDDGLDREEARARGIAMVEHLERLVQEDEARLGIAEQRNNLRN